MYRLSLDLESWKYYMLLFLSLQNWREYEHVHTLLWLCKDLCWNQDQPIPWVIFIIPTLLVGLDFVYITWNTKVRNMPT